MSRAITVLWPTGVQKKLDNKVESEDVFLTNEEHGFFIVADGVSRDVYEQRGYSIAFDAAHVAASAMAKVLVVNKEMLAPAFMAANWAVRNLNERKGLWGKDNHNYLDRDLSGTCLAVMVRQEGYFDYGCVGDCRVFGLSPDGTMFVTPDPVREARAEFPPGKACDERTVTIRRERRNNPSSEYKTYGVLTGESAALDPMYLNLGRVFYRPGDVIGVCSDGVFPFIENSDKFRTLLLHGSQEEIYAFGINPSSPGQNTDEKTLVLCRM